MAALKYTNVWGFVCCHFLCPIYSLRTLEPSALTLRARPARIYSQKQCAFQNGQEGTSKFYSNISSQFGELTETAFSSHTLKRRTEKSSPRHSVLLPTLRVITIILVTSVYFTVSIKGLARLVGENGHDKF